MSLHLSASPRQPGPRHLWGRLAVTLIPVALLGVALKLVRIGAFYPESSSVSVVVQTVSDASFGAAWGLLWVLACLYLRGPLARRIALATAQITTCLLGVFIVVNHAYTIRTGSPLTAQQIAETWHAQGELAALLSSQLEASVVALLVIVAGSTLVLPLLLGPLTQRLFTRRASTKAKRATAAALVLLIAGSGFSAPTASATFALAPPVQLAVTPLRQALAYPEHLADDAPLPDPATTRLVPEPGQRHRNLVIITLESHRATSTFPETRQPVTPVLDALARDSVRPERGYTVLPHTSKALTAVHCGVAPPPDRANSEADLGGLPARCLPELLAEQGYETAFFQSATEKFERRRKTASNLGFDYFKSVDQMKTAGFHRANYFGYEDDIMLEPAMDWVGRQGDGPFLLSMLTVTAHHDYKLQGYEPISFVDDPLLNAYLNSVHYQDRFVGKVIDSFKEAGLYDDTVFVITGDHGEGFGEHRVYQHDQTIYDEGLRIPLMVHDPQREPLLIDGPANQLALLPTAADALGFELSGEPTYRPSLFSGEPQGPIVATCYTRARCTATLDGDMKVIHHFGDRRDEVFNLAEDPYELRDLAGEVDASWIAEQRDLALGWYLDAERHYGQR